jgi:hypothetical protein
MNLLHVTQHEFIACDAYPNRYLYNNRHLSLITTEISHHTHIGMEVDSADDEYTTQRVCNIEPEHSFTTANTAGTVLASIYVESDNRDKSPMITEGDEDVNLTDTQQTIYNQSRVPRSCWLCEFQGNRTTNEVIRFIMDGIPHMSLDSLIEQSKYLLDQVDVGSDATTAEIRKHVTEHMLHPRVKLALQMQEMSRMQKEVCKCCISADGDTGERTINPPAMRVYLSLCSQISGVYKLGEDKLMYNQGSMDK